MGKEKMFYGYINQSIEIELSKECIENCAHSGDCDEDTQRWVEIPEIKKQFDKVKKDTLIKHILEYGCHEEKELKRWNKKQLSVWVLWSVCFDILDSEEFNEED